MHWKRWRRHGDPLHVERIIGDRERRFWSRVEKSSDPDGCWIWTGSLNAAGYGTVGWGENASQTWLAHRVAYTLDVGPVPSGSEIDHLCRVRACVRPSHMEAVDHTENVRRGASPSQANAAKTHCMRGHAFDEANTMLDKRGYRRCRTCVRDYMREYQRRRRQGG